MYDSAEKAARETFPGILPCILFHPIPSRPHFEVIRDRRYDRLERFGKIPWNVPCCCEVMTIISGCDKTGGRGIAVVGLL